MLNDNFRKSIHAIPHPAYPMELVEVVVKEGLEWSDEIATTKHKVKIVLRIVQALGAMVLWSLSEQ